MITIDTSGKPDNVYLRLIAGEPSEKESSIISINGNEVRYSGDVSISFAVMPSKEQVTQ